MGRWTFRAALALTLLPYLNAQQMQCSSDLNGECNSCVCCCYRGAVPRYVPDGCDCKAEYGDSFYVMIAIAAATLVTSFLTSIYFINDGSFCGGSSSSSSKRFRFSPFPPPLPPQDAVPQFLLPPVPSNPAYYDPLAAPVVQGAPVAASPPLAAGTVLAGPAPGSPVAAAAAPQAAGAWPYVVMGLPSSPPRQQQQEASMLRTSGTSTPAVGTPLRSTSGG
eukprot:CAMPEP_0202895692 /NCGR_PEP_ID=MMETSP1392-20130828/4847_1 /ASSEMBLY_ACC=CAM_ASM_000868 /TAXON_ID=225041 /ORGANISM="Chlamydomonas chlamydogama, Strain SAG 11-48b" /LENGTH=220 /DNA_ID=CAMNT_0049580799 /DNA_START=47 /DNA_END=705 /DNA_ORIENTATION=+